MCVCLLSMATAKGDTRATLYWGAFWFAADGEPHRDQVIPIRCSR